MSPIQETLRELVGAWKFVCATRRRRLFIIVPIFINLILWLVVLPFVYWFVTWVTSMNLPDATWATVLSILAGVFAVLAAIILAVFAFVAVSAIIGAPFYSALAEEVLKESHLKTIDIPWYKEVWRSIRYTLKLGILFVIAQLILILFNIVPGIGTAMHAVGAFVIALLFISMEFFGEGFARTGVSFKDRINYLFKNLMAVVAFSVPIFFLLLIPVINLFVVPVAVVAATRIYARGNQR